METTTLNTFLVGTIEQTGTTTQVIAIDNSLLFLNLGVIILLLLLILWKTK